MEVLDTLKEVTVVTVQLNETGDTVRTSTVTDRTRARSRDNITAYKTKVVEKRDTVFIECRDSIKTTGLTNPTNRVSLVVSVLRWVFAIVVALGGLVIIIRLAWRKG